MIETQAPPRCDGNATGRIAGEWGMEAIPCQVRKGLRSFVDGRGVLRFYCPAHESNVERRFGRQYVSEIADDPLGQAKAMDDFRMPGQHGETCWYAGHVPGCPGRSGGDHELLPGWISIDEDGIAVEIEVS